MKFKINIAYYSKYYCLNYLFNSRLIILAILPVAIILSGCGIMVSNVEINKWFPYDNVLLVKNGMHKDEINILLGKPHIIGINKDDNIIWGYDWKVINKSEIYGGAIIVGESGEMTLSGAEIELEYFKDNNVLKEYQYRIYGMDNYDRLRRGKNDKTHN